MDFEIFNFTHRMTLILTIVIGIILIFTTRLSRNLIIEKVSSYIIILSIVSGFSLMIVYKYITGTFTIHTDLPMQFCDWAGIMVVVTLLFRKQLSFELAYFWALSGTTQALLTPNIVVDFPSIEFVYFFLVHSGEWIGVFFMVFALRMTPAKGAIKRAFIASNVYLVVAFIVNYATESNYGFIMHKPHSGSMLDFMGPWPLYILSYEAIALLFYCLYYAPFYFLRKRNKS